MNFHTKSADSPRTTLQASLQCDVIGLNAAISACEKAAVFFCEMGDVHPKRRYPWDEILVISPYYIYIHHMYTIYIYTISKDPPYIIYIYIDIPYSI